jgi:hypothetical protein
MAKRKFIKLSLLVALIMGPITMEIISWVEDVSLYNGTIDFVVNILSFPGIFIAELLHLSGIARESMVSALAILVGNWFFYMAFWYLAIRLVIKIIARRGRTTKHSHISSR